MSLIQGFCFLLPELQSAGLGPTSREPMRESCVCDESLGRRFQSSGPPPGRSGTSEPRESFVEACARYSVKDIRTPPQGAASSHLSRGGVLLSGHSRHGNGSFSPAPVFQAFASGQGSCSEDVPSTPPSGRCLTPGPHPVPTPSFRRTLSEYPLSAWAGGQEPLHLGAPACPQVSGRRLPGDPLGGSHRTRGQRPREDEARPWPPPSPGQLSSCC